MYPIKNNPRDSPLAKVPGSRKNERAVPYWSQCTWTKVPLTKPSLLQPSSLSSPSVRSGLATLPRITLSFIRSRFVRRTSVAPWSSSSRASTPFRCLVAAAVAAATSAGSGIHGTAPPCHARVESGRMTRGTRSPLISAPVVKPSALADSGTFLLRTRLWLWFSVGVDAACASGTSSFSDSILSLGCQVGLYFFHARRTGARVITLIICSGLPETRLTRANGRRWSVKNDNRCYLHQRRQRDSPLSSPLVLRTAVTLAAESTVSRVRWLKTDFLLFLPELFAPFFFSLFFFQWGRKEKNWMTQETQIRRTA